MAVSGRPHPLEKNEWICYHNAQLKQLDQFLVSMDVCPYICGYQCPSLGYRQTMAESPLYIFGNYILNVFETSGYYTRMLVLA